MYTIIGGLTNGKITLTITHKLFISKEYSKAEFISKNKIARTPINEIQSSYSNANNLIADTHSYSKDNLLFLFKNINYILNELSTVYRNFTIELI